MKLVLILSLVLVGVLEIPLTHDSKIKPISKGEVKGEEVNFQKFSKSIVKENVSVLPLPSPRSFLTLTSISISPSPLPSPPPTPFIQNVKEIILLDEVKELKDEELRIDFSSLDLNQNWFLSIEFNLISVEDVLGFDCPSLTIHIDDYLVYQHSFFEDEIKKISFNPKVFSSQPQILSIWSGNNGDEFKDTYAIIKSIKLIFQNDYSFIEIESINDLVVTIDSKDFFTLEWSSPKTNDFNLNKVLAYDIRYSSELITPENWSKAQPVEIFLPQDFSPQSPKTKEIILIKTPLINSGYLAIRSINSINLLSPLGENVFFINLDY